jgi:hypothetical protein
VLAGLLLAVTVRNLRPYFSRVLFVFFLGLFAAALIDLPQGIWYHRPWALPLFDATYHVTGWLMVGLVLGYFVRPARDV